MYSSNLTCLDNNKNTLGIAHSIWYWQPWVLIFFMPECSMMDIGQCYGQNLCHLAQGLGLMPCEVIQVFLLHLFYEPHMSHVERFLPVRKQRCRSAVQ